jgi:adenylate cyclase class 2
MLEVEIKFPVADLATLPRVLHELGARGPAAAEEVDCYFNSPDRDFARTDEALRLRRVGKKTFLTYKGPKRDATTKTRTEIEVPLEPGPSAAEAASALLTSLGYRPVAVVRKKRVSYELTWQELPTVVSLDTVDGVGTYVELEALVPDERAALARAAVEGLAVRLGLEGSERRSYLELWLEKNRAR